MSFSDYFSTNTTQTDVKNSFLVGLLGGCLTPIAISPPKDRNPLGSLSRGGSFKKRVESPPRRNKTSLEIVELSTAKLLEPMLKLRISEDSSDEEGSDMEESLKEESTCSDETVKMERPSKPQVTTISLLDADLSTQIAHVRKLPQPDIYEIEAKKIFLGDREGKKKTIIFDLDETLIHSDEVGNADTHDVKIMLSNGKFTYVNIRPGAIKALQSLINSFEIVLFTASNQAYADPIINYLEKDQKFFKERLYRCSCIEPVPGLFIKDLRIFADRSLQEIVIVDNSITSFGFQLDNGIPITTYIEGDDNEMEYLILYLEGLLECTDVRIVNKNAFDLGNSF